LGERHHRPVRHLDATEPVTLADLDTAAKPVVRADHPPANIFGIAKAAECHGLQLARLGTSRQFQCDPVFPQAAIDVASRETQIAAQEMNPGLLRDEMMPRSHPLGLLQISQRSREIVGHALHCCESDPSCATFLIIDGCVDSSLVGTPSLRHGAEVVQDFALEASQCETIGPIGGQREAALNQLQRYLLAILGRLGTGRRQISSGGFGVLGPLEMFGTQHRIPIGVPFRRAPVELASPAPEQGIVNGVPDQHVGEQEHLAARLLRPQEEPRYQAVGEVIRFIEEMS
jgi:hypothetical protein